ncbi:hypothetical protein LQZ19_15695 [Treponema primitia]|uniref:hypothetical protein n=1 Tax=Treponema primitia TaxID=88058 RepID=UPI003980000B
MPDLTDDEYEALEEEVTKNPPKVSGDGTGGFFAQHQRETLIFLDQVSATWLRVQSEVTHKTQTEIIGELVREKIAAKTSA